MLSTSVQRNEAEYPCCPGEIYPNLAINIIFKKVKAMLKTGEVVSAP